MPAANENPTVAVRSDKDETPQPEQETVYENKNDAIFPPESNNRSYPVGSRMGSLLRAFEQQLVEYNLEARGIERVAPDDRMKRLSWVSYLQAFLLWVSINLAANNITLGMLGPAVYGLSFLDSSLCAVFGCFAGALVAAWMATWGPVSGLRAMVSTIRIWIWTT
jgi:cation transporter-like permease